MSNIKRETASNEKIHKNVTLFVNGFRFSIVVFLDAGQL